MDVLENRLKNTEMFIKLIENLNLYEFLLSIEKLYQKDEDLISFNHSINSYIPIEKNGFHILNKIKIIKTDESGFPLVVKNKILENVFLELENIYNIKNDLLKNKCLKILEDFTFLENREDRFTIYKKNFHGNFPNYKEIINDWKNNNLINSSKESIENYKKNLPEDLSLTLEVLSGFDINKMLQISRDYQNEIKYMLFYMEQKKIISMYPGIEEISYRIVEQEEQNIHTNEKELFFYFELEKITKKEKEDRLPKSIKENLRKNIEKIKICSSNESYLINELKNVNNNLEIIDYNYSSEKFMIINSKSKFSNNPLSKIVLQINENIENFELLMEKEDILKELNLNKQIPDDNKKQIKRL